MAARRPYDHGIIAGVFGDSFIDLCSHVQSKYADTGGDYNREHNQNDLHFFNGHVFERKF